MIKASKRVTLPSNTHVSSLSWRLRLRDPHKWCKQLGSVEATCSAGASGASPKYIVVFFLYTQVTMGWIPPEKKKKKIDNLCIIGARHLMV